MAQYTEIIIDQGAKYSGAIPVRGPGGSITDLTGWAARGQLRRSYDSETGVDFECDIPEPTDGLVFVQLGGSITADMKSGRWVWDVEIYNLSDEDDVVRIAEGQAEVTQRATRPDPYA